MTPADPNKRALYSGLDRHYRRVRTSSDRPPVTIARRLEAAVDTEALPLRSYLSLRILSGGDAGKFKFVAGFSRVGGPDIVEP